MNGLNIAGQLSYDTSLSIVARNMYCSMKSYNIPMSVVPFLYGGSKCYNEFKNEGYHYPVTFLPNWFFQTAEDNTKYKFRENSQYVIAYWFWECKKYIHESFYDSISYVDEIWVPSDYLVDVFSEHTDKPVIKIPYSHHLEAMPDLNVRSHYNMSNDTFVFFFNFDLGSTPVRKNPEGVIEAFKRAFSENDNTILIIKTVRYHYDMIDTINNMLKLINNHHRIIWIHDDVSYAHLMGLIKSANCYISLHRSEGLGLGMMEAMMLGVPVIATGYGGNLEFMNDLNSLLVDYKIVHNNKNVAFFTTDCVWAEPNIDSAIRYMQDIYNNRSAAKDLGLYGQQYLKENFTDQKTGEAVKNRLDYIYDNLIH